MKILLITESKNDYLADCILHGLREHIGENLIDFPRKNSMYTNHSKDLKKTHGLGFTLYGLLPNIPIERRGLLKKIQKDYFDFVIFSSISRQFDKYEELYHFLNPSKTIFVDGDDTFKYFSDRTQFIKKNWNKNTKGLFAESKYFKREVTRKSYYKFPFWGPFFILNLFFTKTKRKFHNISFSIPEEKIVTTVPKKTKDFPMHIVDKEIANTLRLSDKRYVFETEKAYYNDLQSSKFGITTKRAGWDCMRHYEIAANGAVICFKDLVKKPKNCAPYGLIPGVNCLNYSNWDDLKNQISMLNEDLYIKIQYESIKWARFNSTKNFAKRFIEQLEE